MEAPVTFSTSGNVPFSLSKSLTLAAKTQACPAVKVGAAGFQASIGAKVTGSLSGSVEYSVVAGGTLVPPKITTFDLIAQLGAEIDGTLDLKAIGEVRLSHAVRTHGCGLISHRLAGLLA